MLHEFYRFASFQKIIFSFSLYANGAPTAQAAQCDQINSILSRIRQHQKAYRLEAESGRPGRERDCKLLFLLKISMKKILICNIDAVAILHGY